jgi:HEAT repeat protein
LAAAANIQTGGKGMEMLEVILPGIYLLASWLVVDGIVSAMQRKSPFWLTRQIVLTYKRYIRQVLYLRRLIFKDGHGKWNHGSLSPPVLNAVKAVGQNAEKNPESAIDMINHTVAKGNSLVLYGEQGAGKTTVLQAAVIQAARKAYQHRVIFGVVFIAAVAALFSIAPWLALLLVFSIVIWEGLLLRVPLPAYFFAGEVANGIYFPNWFDQQVKGALGGKPVFYDGPKTCLFMDAFDRLRPNQLDLLLQEIHSFSIINPKTSIIAAVRPEIDFSSVLPGASAVDILPLDDEGVRLVSEWYIAEQAGTLNAFDRDREEQFLKQLQQYGLSKAQGMGRNPFWIKMMVTVGKVGPSKARLLHQFFEQKMLRGSRAALDEESPVEIYRNALSYLSLAMHEDGSTGLHTREEFQQGYHAVQTSMKETPYSADDCFSAAHQAGLIEYEPGRKIEFVHPLLQDYFTAHALHLKNDWNYVKEKAEDLSWWAALFLLSGIIETGGNHGKVDELMATLIENDTSIRHHLAAFGIHHGMESPSGHIIPQVVQGLARLTTSGYGAGEQQAIEYLVSSVGEAVVDLFEEMYQSPDPRLQLIATILLCAAGVSRCNELLLEKPIHETLPLFQSLGAPAIEHLIQQLDSDDDVICYRASELLTALGPVIYDYVQPALQHPRARVRRYISRVIARIGGDAAYPLLFQALSDEDYDVWYQAADGLRNSSSTELAFLQRELKNPKLNPQLEKRIHIILSSKPAVAQETVGIDVDQDFDMDARKIEGPSRTMGDPSAFQALLKPGFRFGSMRRKEGRAVRSRTYSVSETRTGSTAERGGADVPVQNQAVHFAKYDNPPDFERILSRLGHPNVFIRSAAIEEVQKFGSTMTPYLLRALETANDQQVDGILDALAEVANINSLKMLRSFRDKAVDPAIRKKADRVIQRSRLRTL